ncbi:hypothetical protein GCM10027280_15100 [Micromonospora polyrhachis]|uniref:Flagellar basal body-associated protein FliL n=1 Tax=Micromonospora polyrhachis TaxID=1282883 RepID=A0A7W7SQT4_9ACTN|nr:hypothetical protein [Micromonospora polyrhachis]MBB4958602.1 flagellar basal body-associated protein FliL [Micromonospora polyrhachis]
MRRDKWASLGYLVIALVGLGYLLWLLGSSTTPSAYRSSDPENGARVVCGSVLHVPEDATEDGLKSGDRAEERNAGKQVILPVRENERALCEATRSRSVGIAVIVTIPIAVFAVLAIFSWRGRQTG